MMINVKRFFVLVGLSAAIAQQGWAVDLAVPPQYTSQNLRDPFEAYVSKEEPPTTIEELQEEEFVPPTLTIQGVIWGGNFPQAIVNNKVVRAGESVSGAEIVRIKSDAIIFKFGKREFTLAAPAAGSNGAALKKAK